jgi:hypothetical protein
MNNEQKMIAIASVPLAANLMLHVAFRPNGLGHKK